MSSLQVFRTALFCSVWLRFVFALDADCNHIGSAPVGVCLLQTSTFSNMFSCEDGEPKEIHFYDSLNCTGTEELMDKSDEDYECDMNTTCDYLMIKHQRWEDSLECKGQVSITETVFVIDSCFELSSSDLGPMILKCNQKETDFDICDCDGKNCEKQNIYQWDRCIANSDDEWSDMYTLLSCPSKGFSLLSNAKANVFWISMLTLFILGVH